MKIKLINKSLSQSNEVSYITFSLSNDFSFKEGQFSMLETEINGNKIKRAYSIASTNYEAKSNKTISFYIKKASEYGLSKFLTHDIKIGDEIEMMGPYGRLTNDKIENNNKYLFISTGSGLGPILSHYNELIRSGEYNKIANIFGERFQNQLIDNIEKSLLLNNDKVYNQIFLSKEEEIYDNYQKGYVQDGLDNAIKFLGSNDIKVFICGKPEMVDDVIEKLIELGIEKENIKAEKY